MFHFKVPKFQKFEIPKNQDVGQTFPKLRKQFKYHISRDKNMIWDLSWIIWSVLESPKIKINDFGARGHVQKPRNHRNEKFEGSHISKSKRYKSKMEQNDSLEL